MMVYFPGMAPTGKRSTAIPPKVYQPKASLPEAHPPEAPLAQAGPADAVPPPGEAVGKSFSDHHTTVENLKDLVRDFVGERNWWDYHTPKNLAASISIEAAELLEHFQWTSPDQPITDAQRHDVGEEMADVLAYLLSLAHVLKIDLAAAIQQKMGKNRRKYPSERFQGTWEKVRR